MSRYISGKVKKFVYERDKGKCVYCNSKENLEYDHIIPFSKGGSNTEKNLQLVCLKCNRAKYNYLDDTHLKNGDKAIRKNKNRKEKKMRRIYLNIPKQFINDLKWEYLDNISYLYSTWGKETVVSFLRDRKNGNHSYLELDNDGRGRLQIETPFLRGWLFNIIEGCYSDFSMQIRDHNNKKELLLIREKEKLLEKYLEAKHYNYLSI